MDRKRWIKWIKGGFTGVMLVTLGGLTVVASAATLCVEKTGVGAAECAATYTTIQAAVNAAADGDLIKVGPGNYSEGTGLSVQKSIEIVAVAGVEKTTINGSGDGVSVGSNRTVTIRGFTISGSNRGVYTNSAVDLTLKNNIIVGITSHGVYCNGNGDNQKCRIVNNTIVGSGGDGIYSDTCGVNCSGNQIYVYSNIIADSINLLSNSEYCFYNTITGAILNTACSNTQTEDPLFVNNSSCAVQTGSKTIDVGSPAITDNDPDGTRNNQGACGGPQSASWWPYPSGGPVITNLTVSPASVPQGGTVTIRATGEVR